MNREPCDLRSLILSKQKLLLEPCDVVGRGKIKRVGNKHVIALPIERNVFALTILESIREAAGSLTDIIHELGLRTISICKGSVNGVPFAMVDKILRNALRDRDVEINICTNETTIPPVDDRPRIVEEYHASAIEGHKGVTKTYAGKIHLAPHERRDQSLYSKLQKLSAE
ncbi:hypothetical protein P5V15_012884 [Pogonomyrmex californicus]